MGNAILDALIDTAKLVPWLLVMHLLIALFERNAASKVKVNKVLRGPLAPLIGGVSGILPQCGFGVVAAKLYARRSIRLGTLFAVFIATSDEAVPILLGNFSKASLVRLLALLGFKLVAALLAGYLLLLILHGKEELTVLPAADIVYHGCHHHAVGGHEDAHAEEQAHLTAHADDDELIEKEPAQEKEQAHEAAHADDDELIEKVPAHEKEQAHEAVHADDDEIIEKKPAHQKEHRHEAAHEKKFNELLLHPLVHTLTVTLYILAVNVLFAIVIYYAGEQRIKSVLDSAKFLQPLIAGLVGLIPNCASSVVLAQTFAAGNITLGAAFAGLSVNAGIGLAVLFKDNRPITNTLAVTAGLYGYSCALGLLLTLLPL